MKKVGISHFHRLLIVSSSLFTICNKLLNILSKLEILGQSIVKSLGTDDILSFQADTTNNLKKINLLYFSSYCLLNIFNIAVNLTQKVLLFKINLVMQYAVNGCYYISAFPSKKNKIIIDYVINKFGGRISKIFTKAFKRNNMPNSLKFFRRSNL